MNRAQELWWMQAKSDHDAYTTLRQSSLPACHQLLHLQMCTEKLAKAYFWRSGVPPLLSHAGLVKFLRYLGTQTPSQSRDRVAQVFAFSRFTDFNASVRSSLGIAYELERLSPGLAENGANLEYPWPHESPSSCPSEYEFPLIVELSKSRGRDFLRMIQLAVVRFPEYCDL